ncbi:hypothetical protein [Mesorhizobium sp.]|uniref:hypothetical protein n=1 Tax=Mesorhizobium sp. TaxID=1871066 RepID=UPI00257CCE6B|nr:hypothetical protein [Mesorhizobium sp.]
MRPDTRLKQAFDLAFEPDVARAVRQKSFNFRRDGRIVLHVEVRPIYQSTGPEAPLFLYNHSSHPVVGRRASMSGYAEDLIAKAVYLRVACLTRLATFEAGSPLLSVEGATHGTLRRYR